MKVAEVGPGEICGEMAFLENSKPAQLVIATDDVEAAAIEWSALSELFQLFPHMGSRFYRSIAISLSRRLREQIGPTALDHSLQLAYRNRDLRHPHIAHSRKLPRNADDHHSDSNPHSNRGPLKIPPLR